MQPFLAVRENALWLYSHLANFFKWVYDQVNTRTLIQSYITLSLFGLIPGGWAVLVPIVGLYAFTRIKLYQKLNPNALRYLFYRGTLTFQFRKRARKLPVKIIEYVRDNPFQTAKLLLSIAIMVRYYMPFSFLTVYGMYRFNSMTWFQTLRDSLANMYHYGKWMATEVHNSSTASQRYAIYGVGSVILVGTMAAIAATLTPFEFLLIGGGTVVGCVATTNDLWNSIKTPIKTVLENPGKTFGLIWGYKFAFFMFPGRIVGSMGPAVGHVEQSSIFSALFGSIFPAGDAWVVFGSNSGGFLGSVFRRMSAYINNLATSIVFSYNGRLTGDFVGVLGPTSFQIFLGIAIGYAVGCMIENITHNLLEGIRYDKNVIRSTAPAQAGITRINHLSEFLYHHRWNIAFLSVVTPLIMASPAGAALAAMTYESQALAALLASSVGLAAFIGMDYTYQAVRRNFFPRRRTNGTNHSNVLPSQDHQQQEQQQEPEPAVVEPALVVSPTVLNFSTRRNQPRRQNHSDNVEAPAQPRRRSARLAGTR